MKQNYNRDSLIEFDDPMLNLAIAVVYSGVVAKDEAFFRSAWAKTVFGGLGIDETPLDWYHMIMDRKERAKHGSRCSYSQSNP